MEVFVKEDLQCLVLFLLSVAWVWREPKQDKCRKRMPQNTIFLLICPTSQGIWNRSSSTQKGQTSLGFAVLFSSPLEYSCSIYDYECVLFGSIYHRPGERSDDNIFKETQGMMSLYLSPSFWVCFCLFQCILSTCLFFLSTFLIVFTLWNGLVLISKGAL